MNDIKLDDDMFEITDDFLVAGMSGNGGFNYAQLRLLGVETPPRTGWKGRLIGKKIPREVARQYLELKGKTKGKLRKERVDAIQTELFPGKEEQSCPVSNNPMIRLAAVMERTRLHVDDGEFLLAYIKELERKCTSEGCIEIVEKISGIQNH